MPGAGGACCIPARRPPQHGRLPAQSILGSCGSSNSAWILWCQRSTFLAVVDERGRSVVADVMPVAVMELRTGTGASFVVQAADVAFLVTRAVSGNGSYLT